MRWRAAKVLTSTCPARTAVSSSSSSEKRGTLFRTSGLHAMVISIAKGLFHLILRSVAGCSRVPGQSEVYFETALAPDRRTGDMAASQHGEGDGHSRIELELTASKAL